MEKTPMLAFRLFRNAPEKLGWRLINYQPSQSKTLAISVENYRTKEECLEAIQSLKKHLPFADIDEQEL